MLSEEESWSSSKGDKGLICLVEGRESSSCFEGVCTIWSFSAGVLRPALMRAEGLGRSSSFLAVLTTLGVHLGRRLSDWAGLGLGEGSGRLGLGRRLVLAEVDLVWDRSCLTILLVPEGDLTLILAW